MSLITIKQITSAETFPVRHPVLRPGKPIASCVFDGDDDATTVHFGLYEDGRLAGVASLFRVKNSAFTEEEQYQLRGMAVLGNHQKKGFGERLLAAAEAYALNQNAQLVWFNARENAVGFYERAGYQKQGGPFTIAGIGPHFVMYKKL